MFKGGYQNLQQKEQVWWGKKRARSSEVDSKVASLTVCSASLAGQRSLGDKKACADRIRDSVRVVRDPSVPSGQKGKLPCY